MNKQRMLILAAALLGGLALVIGLVEGLTAVVLAQDTASITWWVVAGGGGASSADEVVVNSTLGQPIIGSSGEKPVALGAGYWYGAQGPPTAVTLASFTATPVGGDILVEWETAMEIDTVGFNLYRAQSPASDWVRLNDTLIPSQSPGSVFGASYAWLDEDVQGGLTYYYKLEDVEIGGKRTTHGPIAAQAGGPTAVTLRVLSTHDTPSLLLLVALIVASGLAAWWVRKRSTRAR